MKVSEPSKGLATNLSFSPLQIRKNSTPRQIALFSAFWITAVIAGVLIPTLIFAPDLRRTRILLYGLVVILSFILAHSIFLFALKRYIYRRIKLIYKTIHQRKLQTTQKSDVVSADSNIFDEVEKEVEEWTNQQEVELKQFKEWAEYRRGFVGDISHELKTPIFIIQSYLDTLLDGAWEDPERLKRYLKKASKSSERLSTIVQDLEVIAKLESGDLVLDIRSFDIRKLTEEIFEDLEFKAKKHNISLEFKEEASNAFKVNADEERIRQVLTNLISNSIKYGKEGGITKASFYDMDQNILIEIADNGLGIPKQDLNHVFDRFYRVDKSRSRERGGSGLGLSIVKHIIEVHQQTINVRSTEGMGSTFGFTLEKA